MFQREADWKSATALICDVMRGSASLSVQSRSSVLVGEDRQTYSSKWRYEQKQPHRLAPSSAPRLFSPQQLRETLEKIADAKIFLAYEVLPEAALGATADASLAKFSSAEITLVTLTVGAVITSWALVSLGNPRDLILWKMKYHLRDDTL
jgi:hypothetical protein